MDLRDFVLSYASNPWDHDFFGDVKEALHTLFTSK